MPDWNGFEKQLERMGSFCLFGVDKLADRIIYGAKPKPSEAPKPSKLKRK